MSSFGVRSTRSMTVLALAVASAGSASTAAAAPTAPLAADRALVTAAHGLQSCLTARTACIRHERRLQLAGKRQGRVVGVRTAGAAPVLRLKGRKLTWTKLRGASSYILSTKVVGRGTTFAVVRGTSIVLAPSSKTRGYRTRETALGSPWSTEKRVSPQPSPVGGETATASDAAPKEALLSTTKAGGAKRPVATPSPGWQPAPVTPTPPSTPVSAPGAPEVGLVVGSAIAWELSFARTLGARAARMEFPIDTPVSQIAPVVESYARAGIKANLLAGFAGRIPSASEIARLGTWAASFGPGGSFWTDKGLPASLAVDRIEFGNESSSMWQYPEMAGVSAWWSAPQFEEIAGRYANAFRDAATTVRGANRGVRLLAVADVAGRWSGWMNGMFRAVPDLGSYVDGWVVHTYGPQWQLNIEDALSQARSHGASDAIPLHITETGVTTDDGACLSDNAGWDRCMTYAQAASTLTTSVSAIKAHFGARLKDIDLYSARDLSDPGVSTDREHHFGALKADGSPKGAFTDAVKALLAS